ncbi:porin [Caballeronia calidae]
MAVLCGAVPLAAHAQSAVTLYGMLNEGFQYNSNAGGKQQYSMANGALGGSRWCTGSGCLDTP